MSSVIFSRWMASQKPLAHTMQSAPAFYRNLEEALDVRRRNKELYTLIRNTWSDGLNADFCSNDALSLGPSGRLRAAFEEELARNIAARLGPGGSRLMDGNFDYIETVEQEIADYHGVEAALIVGSGSDANVAVLQAIPRPGDVLIYDELVHASIIDGMALSLAGTKTPFAHNDVDAFREVLISTWDSQPLIRQGKRCVLIIIESFYSMRGDICRLRELVQTLKEIFPDGNAQFIIDESHSMGLVGDKGLGLVQVLGLDSEIAIKTHTFSKAFASIGGVVLGSHTIKNTLINFARSIMFTTAPAFHQVAAIRAGYALMLQPETQTARDDIQHRVRHFFTKMTAHHIWEEANERGIISIPIVEGWDDRDFQTQLVPLQTRERYGHWLTFHLDARKYSVFPVTFPVVPKGNATLRIVIHADHSEEQIDGLVTAIGEWAGEMVDIESNMGGRAKVPWAAQQVYALAEQDALNDDARSS